MDGLTHISLPAVMRVMPENITRLWPQLEALFRPALLLTSTHTADDVRRALMAMRRSCGRRWMAPLLKLLQQRICGLSGRSIRASVARRSATGPTHERSGFF
jgi:hypothetical protein